MNHFAYPNVIPKRNAFIGCGRYKVCRRGSTAENDYTEIKQTPNTPNRSDLEYALQLLAPTSFDSEKIIMEKQDQSTYRYQGNSLDLAYFLAHVHREAPLEREYPGDIWCTGSIKVKEGLAYLHKVNENGFSIKLLHFLSLENKDRIFLVPAANMQQESLDAAATSGAKVRSITQISSDKESLWEDDKIILKILPGEFPKLMDLLFSGKVQKKRRLRTSLLAFLTITIIIAVGGWWLQRNSEQPSSHEIIEILEGGNLKAAEEALEKFEDSPSLKKLQNLAISPQQVDIIFTLQRDGQLSVVRVPVQMDEGKNLTLSHKDDYRLEITVKKPKEKSYLYIFQIDELGKTSWIYPNISWKMENPVEAVHWPISIPTEEDQWLFLDELETDKSEGSYENIHIFIAPWRAVNIEELLNSIISETDRVERSEKIAELEAQLKEGRKTKFKAVEYYKLQFLHI